MSALVINILAFLVPLILLPILISVVLFKNNLDLPYHWWLGVLLISLAAIVFHALQINPAVYSAIITVSILGFSVWQRQAIRLYVLRVKEFAQNTNYMIVIMTVIVITIGGLLEITTHPIPLGGDTFSIWLDKTKSIYSGVPYPALPVVEYPSLGPTFNAFVMRFTGNYKAVYGLFLGPIAYGFWVLSFLSLFNHRSGWILPTMLASNAIIFFDNYVINGYQDKIVMMCASMSALAYIQFFNEVSLSHREQGARKLQQLFLLGTFFAGMLGLIKSEGTIMGGILLGVGLLIILITRPKSMALSLKNYYVPVIMFIALILLWPLVLFAGKINLSTIQGNNLSIQSILDVPKNLGRIYVIWPYYVNYFLGVFPLLLISVFLTIIAFLKASYLRVSLVYLWTVWFVHLLFILIVFLSTRAPLVWHLDTAFSRLASQQVFVYPLVVLLVTAFLLDNTNYNVTYVESKSIVHL